METLPQKKCLIILGMHRSGTSCLAGALQEAGLYLGNVSTHNVHNKKGNREHERIMQLNDDILSYNGGSWKKVPDDIIWNTEHETEGCSVIRTLEVEAEKYWGFKDPRTTITFPFWKHLLPEAQLIGSFRHPKNVAKSLNNRDKDFSQEEAFELWLSYNYHLLRIYEATPFPVISFDLSDANYTSHLGNIIQQLGLSGIEVMNFFDSELRNCSIPSGDNNLSNNLLTCYEQLCSKITP